MIKPNIKEIEIKNPTIKTNEPEIDLENPDLLNEDYDQEDIDPDRELSNQDLINALEDGITKLEKFSHKKLVQQLSKTVVLICKILAVELDKLIPEDSAINYIG